MPGALWTIDEVRKELLALQDSSSFHKPDFYRIFTTRLKEIFGSLQVVKGDSTLRDVEMIYANPERAVAKIVESRTTNLPLLSIQFDGLEVDSMRRRPMEAIVDKKFWDPKAQRAVRYLALAPVAANISFSINIWGKYIEEVNQLTEQIVLKFRPNLPVDIKKDEVYQAYLTQITDSMEQDMPDRKDRILKRVAKFEVQSYIPSKVFKFTNTGEIVSVNYEAYIEEANALQPLESFEGGGAAFATNRIPNRALMYTTTSS